jgi:hypothetical protein
MHDISGRTALDGRPWYGTLVSVAALCTLVWVAPPEPAPHARIDASPQPSAQGLQVAELAVAELAEVNVVPTHSEVPVPPPEPPRCCVCWMEDNARRDAERRAERRAAARERDAERRAERRAAERERRAAERERRAADRRAPTQR